MSRPAPPLLVAHRAGNHPARVGPALAAGADVIEMDVHARAGRVEVRHPRRIGPLAWDGEGVARARAAPRVEDVAAAAPAGAVLMLDLKRGPAGLATAAVEAARRGSPDRALVVSSRRWGLLDGLAGAAGVRPVLSAGDEGEVAALLRRLRRGPEVAGASIHRPLLVAGLVEEVRERAPLVMTWPVDSEEDARRLAGRGVGGLICDDLALIWRLARGRDPA